MIWWHPKKAAFKIIPLDKPVMFLFTKSTDLYRATIWLVVDALVRGIFWGGSLCDVIEFKSNQNTNESMTLVKYRFGQPKTFHEKFPSLVWIPINLSFIYICHFHLLLNWLVISNLQVNTGFLFLPLPLLLFFFPRLCENVLKLLKVELWLCNCLPTKFW